MRSSLKELRERRAHDRTEAEGRPPSATPLEVVLSATGAITEPVSLAEALTSFGLPLDEAHAVLNRLTAGEDVPVSLHLTPDGEMPFALSRFGLSLRQSIGAERAEAS